jgi:DNA-binding transcriptional MocR family regulator
LPIDAIAALAGVSRTTVQNALRAAKALGLIFARERRRLGLPSLTNVLRVISPEWAAWLKLSGEGGGYKNLSATNNKFIQERKNGFKPVDQKGAQRETVDNPKGPCRPLAQRVTFY